MFSRRRSVAEFSLNQEVLVHGKSELWSMIVRLLPGQLRGTTRRIVICPPIDQSELSVVVLARHWPVTPLNPVIVLWRQGR